MGADYDEFILQKLISTGDFGQDIPGRRFLIKNGVKGDEGFHACGQ